jgi:nucleotide-binding universal stress UspA family protein
MIALENILVATDFGVASETALAYGRALAERFGAKLHLLHVTADVYLAASMGYGYEVMPLSLQEQNERNAKRELDGLLSDEDRQMLRATGVVVTNNTPALAIAEYAKNNKANLIVMGTHGRGALAHLFMGSVAERVVRIAPCPVLTVRNPEHEFVLPDALVAVSRA